jgi:hypothetical protein
LCNALIGTFRARAVSGTGDNFRAGIERAIALGWLWLHESGTYVKFTDSGAALFA